MNNDNLTAVMDVQSGATVPPPEAMRPQVVQMLIDEARRMHDKLSMAEWRLIERTHKQGQLWLAAAALFAASGLYGGHTGDWWIAFGFACGFALSVALTAPQRAVLLGMSMVDLNDPYALGDSQTAARLLSTLDTINTRSAAALRVRVTRYSYGVWALVGYLPLSLLLRALSGG